MKSRSFFHFIVIVLFFIFGSVATPTQAKPLSAPGDFVWAMGLGSPGFDAGSDIAVDGDGNVYTTGYFSGNVDFDPGPGTAYLTAAGYWASDIFVSKLDTNGNFVWAINMGGTGYEEGAGIAVDGNGNIYITGHFGGTAGYFNGTPDFDPGLGVANLTSAGREDIFISKLDANGNYLWVKGMGGSEVDQGYSIAVDREGNVYTTGYFQGTADFDPGPDIADLVSAGGADSAGRNDIFISKLDSNGNYVWAKAVGGAAGFDEGRDIALDEDGNVYTTGIFYGTADFDPGPSTANLISAGYIDIFVSKLDVDGNYIWAKGMGEVHTDVGSGIAVDGGGNVYTTGYFYGTVDFDPGPGIANLISAGGYDGFVSKIDTNGNYLWAKDVGGISSDFGTSVAVDEDKNVYIMGLFGGIVDFDPGPGTANLSTGGIFVSKLDSSGNYLWANAIGGTGLKSATGITDGVFGKGIAVDVRGNVYTTGLFYGTADFDSGPGTYNLTAAGEYDILISKLGDPHTVTFNGNGGSGSMSNQVADSLTVLTTNTFIRPGYTFSGWNTAADGSGTFFMEGATYDFTSDIILYAQWTLSPTFADVPFDYWAWQWIESIYSEGITGGCSTNPLNYCPTQVVTRAQMAVFILKEIHGSSFTPPVVTGRVFGDVPASHWAAAWIEQFASEGITAGCGNGNYCPDQAATTRAQMAVFLLRAKYGAGYVPPAVGVGTSFNDVPADYWAAAWIKQFAAEGITGGCGGGNYCPEGSLTRDQMAVFLQRTFNLLLP